jgi:hypothetical protein
MEGGHIVNSREVYRALWKNVLCKCRAALIEYGSGLLAKTERNATQRNNVVSDIASVNQVRIPE